MGLLPKDALHENCLFSRSETNRHGRVVRSSRGGGGRQPWPPSCPPPHSSDLGSFPLVGEPTLRIGQPGGRARAGRSYGRTIRYSSPLPARVAVAAHARLAGAVLALPPRVVCPADPRAWLSVAARARLAADAPSFDPPALPCWFCFVPGVWGLSLLAGSCVCAACGCVEPSDPAPRTKLDGFPVSCM